jgi:3'-5' exoribonuclease
LGRAHPGDEDRIEEFFQVKSVYAAGIEANQTVTSVFLVQFKDVRQKKSGEVFLNLVLADRSGDLEAKMWDNADKVADTFEKDDFVRVKGMAQLFQNRLQFTVHTLTRVDEGEVDLIDFLPASKRDPEEMFAELGAIIEGIGNLHLRGLLQAIFRDSGIAQKFKRAPAAKTIHHAWLAGLIEHVLSLCELCKLVTPRYPGVDLDLMLTGAILHDIGKIDELTYGRSFGYSDVGQLIGHINIGMRIVADKIREVPDFPEPLRILVEHMILSHHGELEFGSPKTPMFAEAMLLHHLDNLDSKMETVRLAAAKDRIPDSNFSSFVPSLERPVLRKERFLNPLAAEQRKPAPSARPQESPRQQTRGPGSSVMADQIRKALLGG